MITIIIIIIFNENNAEVISISRLPSFANDNTELFIAAVIEREFKSTILHLDLILMGHKALSHMPQLPILAMNKSTSTISHWKDAALKWNPNRELNLTSSGYLCKIHINNDDAKASYYYTTAHWIPDTTTNDSGFNKNINVLRCRLKYGYEIYKKVTNNKLYGPVSKLTTEIVRKESNGFKSIIKFTVPYRSRRTGYGFSISRRGSRFNPWFFHPQYQGITINNKTFIYGCMSAVRPLEPYRADTGLPMLLENIEHSLSIGIDHLFIGIYFDWKSVHYQRYSLALSSYISAGRVTLASLSLEGSFADDVVGILGVVFLDDYVKWIHHSQCLYMSKGQADYIAVFHASEMMSLTPKFNSLNELLYAYNSNSNGNSNANTKSSINPCYYLMQSYGLVDPKGSSSFGPGDSYWTQDWFTKDSIIIGPIDGWEIIVVNTSNAWMIGWHAIGACSKSSSSSSSSSSSVPWSTDTITHKTHSYILPLDTKDGAAVYFYRGAWEEFQLLRQWPKKNVVNYHLRRYGSTLNSRLSEKGFTISDGHLNYEVNKEIAERMYPAYFHHRYSYNGRISGKMKGNSNNSQDAIIINLSVTRSKINEAILPFKDNNNDDPKIVAGRQAMKQRDGTWMECNDGCKYFKDILLQ